MPAVGLLRSIADPEYSLQMCFQFILYVPDEALMRRLHRQLRYSQLLGRTPEGGKKACIHAS